MSIATFRKAITPAVLGVAGVVISWVASGDFDLAEFRIVAAGLVTAVAVYVVPNVASTPFLKALVPGFLGVVAVGASALESGAFDSQDLRLALASLLTSALVWLVPNKAGTSALSTR